MGSAKDNKLVLIHRFDVFEKYHPGFARDRRITAATVHGSAGGESVSALFNWWSTIDQKTDKWSMGKTDRMRGGQGFYNYIIDLNGDVYYTLPENMWSFNAHSGQMDANSIAICLVNSAKMNAARYTDSQYISLVKLLEDLRRRHDLRTIDSHSFRAMLYSNFKTPTPCPGDKFDWTKLVSLGITLRSY